MTLLLFGTLLFTLLMGLLFIFRPRPDVDTNPYDRLRAARGPQRPT